MQRKSAQSDRNSLKTFIVYGGVVLFFVFLSLLIKAAFVIHASKFDGKHQFVLEIYQSNKIKEIIKFNPQENKISIAELNENSIEIIPDAKVNSDFDIPLGENVSKTMSTIGFKYSLLKTDLTLFDIIRLTMFSYKASVEPIYKSLTENFFVDELISSENETVQIINASGISGEGKRLESSLTNLGFDVISVTTDRKEEKSSEIKYFGQPTYTLKKLEMLLKSPSEKMDKETIADIIIIIGKDSK